MVSFFLPPPHFFDPQINLYVDNVLVMPARRKEPSTGLKSQPIVGFCRFFSNHSSGRDGSNFILADMMIYMEQGCMEAKQFVQLVVLDRVS